MMTMMISHHKRRDNGNGHRSGDRVHPHAQVPQVPQIQPMFTPEPDDVSDEDFTDWNPSSPSAGPPPSAVCRGRSRREHLSHTSQQPQPVVPPSRVQQTQTLATQGSDEDSATVDPQNGVSGRSRSPQEQESSRRQDPSPQRHDPSQQRGKKTVAEKQPNEPPKAKKHKSTESDEDDEEPRNEPGTSSNTQPTVPMLRYNSGDEDSEHSSEYSARSQDSGRTVFHPDLNVLTDEEHFTMTPATHKYAAGAGSCCFSMTENGEQQDLCNLITMPCVQRSLYLNEVTNDFESINAEVPDGVDGQTRDMLERCMATCGRAARTRAKKKITCTKGSISPRCPRILQHSLSIGSMSPDLGDVAKWTSHKPNVGRRFGPALYRWRRDRRNDEDEDNNEGDGDDQGHRFEQVIESHLWVMIRDFLSTVDALEMRTTAHKWNIARLYGN